MYPLRLGRYNDNDVTRARLIVFDGGLFFFCLFVQCLLFVFIFKNVSLSGEINVII